MIRALLLTIIIELPICLILFKRKDWLFIVDVILINVITNLSLNLLLSLFPLLYGYILLLEVIIVITEALLYKSRYDLELKRLLLYSFLANAISFVLGLIILPIL